MSISELPARSEVPEEATWDFTSIFPSLDAWEQAFHEVENRLPDLQRFQGHLSESPQVLLDWIYTYEEVAGLADRVGQYARLGSSVDATDQAAKARSDRVSSLSARVQAASAFAEPEILAIDRARISEWIEQDPSLAVYAHFFERLWQRATHVRSPEVEQVLSQVADPFRSAAGIHGILANADMKFRPAQGSDGEAVPVSHSNIGSLLNSRDRELRKSAWENYADAHLDLQNSQAACLTTGVKQDVFNARARGYRSSLEAALAPNFIPLEVFHNLIATFRKHLPTWHRYWRLRQRALGLDQIHVYDLRAALTERMPEVSFRQAADWVFEGMQPLGEAYGSALRKGVLEERWVDYHPNKGKRFGAFSSGVKGTHPFVMMSFNKDIFSASTLAHELGHSMHSYYSRSIQPQLYSYYGIFLAEVASNFNQAMVRDYLLRTQTDPNTRIAILEEGMANFHRYFFIMPTLARFELAIHEQVEQGQGLSAQGMIDLLADMFAEGYGPDVVVDRQRVGSTWMQFSTHLYANFYVFQYATGISGAHALAERVLNGGEPARQAYLEYLRAGSSRFPLDTLRMAGVDLSTPEPVEKTFGIMESYIDQLEQLVAT